VAGVGNGGAVAKVTARCDREEGCPLYQRGDRVEFASVAVSGVERAPVCYRAVIKFIPVVEKIRGGGAPWNFDNTFCGGCEHGKAWFAFQSAAPDNAYHHTTRFEEFAMNALTKIKLFAGVHPTIARRIVPLIRERSVRAGDIIVRSGERIGALCMILGGRYDVVTRDEKQAEKHLMTLGRGDCIGEASLVTGEPSFATVVAGGVGQLLEIPSRDFPTLLALIPTLGLGLARDVLQRFSRMGASSAADDRSGIIGRLEVVGAGELVQAMSLNRQTGVLTVTAPEGTGSMYFEEGRLLDASMGAETGAEPFYRFLRWTKGTFRFEAGKHDVAASIREDTIALLLEGMRRIDEASKQAVIHQP